MADDHIHTVGDGRGFRHVYVDGRKVEKAVYADTRRGIVVCNMTPTRLDKRGKRVLTRRLRGEVEVVPIG